MSFSGISYYTIIYSAGLRITEAVRIRIKSIDSKRMLIHIVQSKNRNDRYVILAQKTLKLLREYYIQKYVFMDSGIRSE